VALPDIQRSLHASFTDLQWVINAYSLTLAAFLLTAGVVGDMFGRRIVFAVGLAAFSVSSLVCGLSSSAGMLDLARAVQGIGGAIMLATSLALIAQAFRGKDRGTAFGIYGAVLGGAVAIGPLVGGALTSGLGWRWIFFVNVPIGVVAIAITMRRVQESRGPSGRKIDWAGFISFSLSLFALVFALVRANDEGWGSTQIVGLLVGSAVLMAIFIAAELRQADPMLDLALFKRPAMLGISLASFTIASSIFSMFLYITLYIQDVLGYGPFAAGLRFLPITLLAFVVAPVSGKLTVRLPSRWLLGVGFALIALGLLLMADVGAASKWTVLLPGFVIAGIGIGISNPVIASGAVAVVPHQRSGMASGSANTFRSVGIATGIAALGSVFQTQVHQKTLAALNATTAGSHVLATAGAGLKSALLEGAVLPLAASMHSRAAGQALVHAYRTGFSASFDNLAYISAVIALVGAVACVFLVRQRDFVPSGGAPPAADA
jgi:EmrB/QacA subfamily drug resistance transporter